MSDRRVLIVEDELTQLVLLESVVSKAGYIVEKAMTGREAVNRLIDRNLPEVDVVLLDLVMPELTGIEVLEHIRPTLPNLPVVMLTSKSSINTVVKAMQAGANDFLVKPASAERIRTALAAAMETSSFVGEIAPMQESLNENGFDGLVGNSTAMNNALSLAKKASNASIPVLIEGESGVGKEVFANAIHDASLRAGKPFVAVNCGAIPENLVESILFGHEKGAFTGATEKRIGKFQEADGGTLFLDEVGELPLDVQVKLLRALQEKEIDPVGSRHSIKVNIRVISATNRNLTSQVRNGAFREDLLYRLNVFPISLPPLRERRNDVPALTEHFLERIANMEGLPHKNISDTAMSLLSSYHWPGNIRQLQNALFRAVILSESETLNADDFPHLSDMKSSSVAEEAFPKRSITDPSFGNIRYPEAALNLEDTEGQFRRLNELEADIISKALKKYNGKMTEVARRLGIGRSTLYRKVAEHGLEQ
ncbi:sigma-54 dependent transcriptional regulator [Kordiimonas sp. SCSIO 12610]|uniref:sigma-54-dependent transcriptional regulator n=1 Tax=Kordiimonas sp. SCSIO 12610 TaxID=2829597 RepID=UPI00210AB7B1|nr:sigma-54 dependent transcriptional regulator [Kordiimonas sp. SCSIO 12610]UTW55001.1 sigma-54-dependent Fis family transcriptional regulator [Kordiimonas sp. SCSIO 12610]